MRNCVLKLDSAVWSSIKSVRWITSASLEQPVKPDTKEKLIKVAIIGAPNAGKSTFINNLINHRVCPTSNKVHTTRKAAKAIHVKNNNQMVLFDTPGLVTNREIKKHHLEGSFVSSPRYSIQHSNLVAVIHDISSSWTRNSLHPTVLETLEFYKKVGFCKKKAKKGISLNHFIFRSHRF